MRIPSRSIVSFLGHVPAASPARFSATRVDRSSKRRWVPGRDCTDNGSCEAPPGGCSESENPPLQALAVLPAALCCLLAALLPATSLGETVRLPLDFAARPALSGWTLTVGQATVDDQQLILPGGSALAYSDFSFDDFVVELDYCRLGTGAIEPVVRLRNELGRDTGQLHGPAITLAAGQRGPRGARRRANLRNSPEAAGVWQHLRIECIGDHAVVYRNSSPAGSHCLDRGEGLLALAAHGDCQAAVAFRNVVVTETRYRHLFNGRDLQGWEGAGSEAASCWEAQHGLLVCNGAPGPWLRSREQYGDFNLRLQYQLKDGGNSGVYVRVPADGLHHGAGAGLEVQILDDASPRYRDLKPYQFSASLYAIAPATPGSTRAVGQWNALEIDCRGTRYRVTHNGQAVIDTSAVEFPELAERLVHGFLGLQNHSETVWFRQLRIGPPR